MKYRIPSIIHLFLAVNCYSQKVIDFPPKIVIICKDADTRKLMAGVKVQMSRNDTLLKAITTDGCGRCLLLKPRPGNYSFAVTKAGYYAFKLTRVSIPADQTVTLEIPMDGLPIHSKSVARLSEASLEGTDVGQSFR